MDGPRIAVISNGHRGTIIVLPLRIPRATVSHSLQANVVPILDVIVVQGFEGKVSIRRSSVFDECSINVAILRVRAASGRFVCVLCHLECFRNFIWKIFNLNKIYRTISYMKSHLNFVHVLSTDFTPLCRHAHAFWKWKRIYHKIPFPCHPEDSFDLHFIKRSVEHISCI